MRDEDQEKHLLGGPICSIQRDFPCLSGKQVTLVLDTQGECWISLSSACQVLSLNVRGQVQHIGRDRSLQEGLSKIVLSTRGGPQNINCLKIAFLQPWLAKLKKDERQTYQQFSQEVNDAALLLRTHEDDTSASFTEPIQGVLFEPNCSSASVDSPPVTVPAVTQVGIATTLPGLSQVLFVANYPEEVAIRQAALGQWSHDASRKVPYFMASNKVLVNLGDPAQPLVVEDDIQNLSNLPIGARERLVFTARYIIAQWLIAYEQGKLAEDRSVFIHPEAVLEWRGIAPHSREPFPGAQVRQIERYEQKHLDQVHSDIKYLELFYLQAVHRLLDRVTHQQRVLSIDGSYLRVTHVQDPDSGQRGYSVAPGGWINLWLAVTSAHGGLWIAELAQEVFRLHPHNDQIAIRLALYLAEHWQMQLAAGLDVVPISMEALLSASMISIDRPNLTTRFVGRVEAAITKLLAQGIIGDARPQQILVRTKKWGNEWLAMHWEIRPPAALVERYQQRRQNGQSQFLLIPEHTGGNSPKIPSKRVKIVRKTKG